jgi:hypothetical protein
VWKSCLDSKATNPSFKLESILEAESIIFESNQTCQIQFYTSGINYGSSKRGTKHRSVYSIDSYDINAYLYVAIFVK